MPWGWRGKIKQRSCQMPIMSRGGQQEIKHSKAREDSGGKPMALRESMATPIDHIVIGVCRDGVRYKPSYSSRLERMTSWFMASAVCFWMGWSCSSLMICLLVRPSFSASCNWVKPNCCRAFLKSEFVILFFQLLPQRASINLRTPFQSQRQKAFAVGFFALWFF